MTQSFRPAQISLPDRFLSGLRRSLIALTLATAMAIGMLAAPATQSTAAAAPASAGQAAADHARSLVGSTYQWGATGSGAYDCSGLTLSAWRAAGVTLPRTSRDQSRAVQSVSRSNLRPGDLVFFHRPVSHVAIYVGNGEIVEASRSRKAVAFSTLSRRSGVVGYGRP